MLHSMKCYLRGKYRIYYSIAIKWLRVPKNRIVLAGAAFCYLWLSGFITQFPHNRELWQEAGGFGSGVNMRWPSLNPLKCLWVDLISSHRMVGLSIVGLGFILFGLLFYFRYNDPEAAYDEERNFYYSKKGLYGTAGWMEKDHVGLVLDVTPESEVEQIRGDILGVDDDGNIFSVPPDSFLNRHVAIFGASGSMKSRAYSRNKIIISALRGESLVVTDPKGELLEDTAAYLQEKGYEIRVLNLVNPELSNGWNFLLEVEREGDIMAQTMANGIIANTGGPKPDHFWDAAEMNLLKALMLYVAENEKITTNMPKAYQMLTQFENIEDLTALFNSPTVSPAALQPYNLFLKANENVQGNVMIGLGSRLQVFQNQVICRMTERDEIDLEAPAKRRCAYFCIMSDQDSSLNFISSLFFSMLFIKLVKYVDTKCRGPRKGTNIPVNFVLDEFPNIGLIPDFTKKISTIRSRKLNVSVIFQTLTQLQNRYPDGQWEEIIGNCDVQLFLGCTDLTTAKYISERSGIVSVLSSTQAKEWNEMSAVEYQPHFRESKTIGKRYLLNPDEVLTLPMNKCLLILRGQKILKANKFDFSRHPQSSLFRPIEILKYNPLEEVHPESSSTGEPEKMEPMAESVPNTTPKEEKENPIVPEEKTGAEPVMNNAPQVSAHGGHPAGTEKPPAKPGPHMVLQPDGKKQPDGPPPVSGRKIELEHTFTCTMKGSGEKPDIRKKS